MEQAKSLRSIQEVSKKVIGIFEQKPVPFRPFADLSHKTPQKAGTKPLSMEIEPGAVCPAHVASRRPVARITLLQLIAATYFMVAGGPYGLEDLVSDSGYLMAVAALLVVPIIWSLPTALMVSELSSALPQEGGYYTWVRRAMGPFWGFQEAWLSLAASVFDMAIYPTLFVKYLSGLWPPAENELTGWLIKLAMIGICVLGNIRGARTVGRSSLILTFAMLSPFVVLTVVALARSTIPADAPKAPIELDYLAGIVVAMFNYMGWDNASTVAGEVDRPQRTYPLAMISAMLLVALTYLIPVLAVWRSGLDRSVWDQDWVGVGQAVAGPALGVAISIGGMISAFGMFNALVMSYSRVPMVLAEDGYMPAILKRVHPRTGAPWVSIIVCAVAWAAALQLSLPRLFALDVILYGLSLILEFVALVVLRLREPGLARPFRVPGGLIAAAGLGLGPAILILLAMFHERQEMAGPIYSVLLGVILVALGPIVYLASRRRRQPPSQANGNG
jgi:amino acid transporter